ncbi:hypothetical protein P7C70_g5178, partial [Phenoliferia sp. Uapishka_3]
MGPPSARASFSTLPLEIKARIVEMASLQEDGFKERVLVKSERIGHVNSLSALATVSWELRGLAAKHQFKVLCSTQVQDEAFRFSILIDHPHQIQLVQMMGTDRAKLSQAMSILPQLHALRGLTFTLEAAQILFGPVVKNLDNFEDRDPEFSVNNGYNIRGLRRIAEKVHLLSLDDFSSMAAATLVSYFPNLRTLSLIDVTDSTGDDFNLLAVALSSLRSLTHFSLEAADTENPITVPTSLDILRALPPPIRCLQISLGELSQPLLDFISIFGPTLVTLDLRVDTQTPGSSELAPLLPLHLPHLSNLAIRDCWARTPRLFSLLANCNLHKFAYCENDDDGEVDFFPPHVLDCIKSQKNLRQLKLGVGLRLSILGATYINPSQSETPSPSTVTAYFNLVHSRGLDTSPLEESFLSPFHRRAKLDFAQGELDYLAGALGRTLEFGRNELERIIAEGDVSKAVRWLKTLGRLERERLGWRD